MIGRVKDYYELRGFGFIVGEDNNDYFVHYTMINMKGIRTLKVGDQVTFNPIRTSKGLQAWTVENLIEPEKRQVSQEGPISLKLNPFTPQDPITDPNKFAGRVNILGNAIDGLFNFKNILITGARGIGKSSIAYQLLNLTQGDKTLINRLKIDTRGYEFNHIVGDHRCVPGNTLQLVAKNLLNSIRYKSGLSEEITKMTSRWGFDFKIFNITEEVQSSPLSYDELAMEFSVITENLLHGIKDSTTGICFLIDEVDALDKDVNIAPFLKSVIEKLRMDGYSNVNFVLSGVTGTVTELIAQHPSAGRLTENIDILPMKPEEIGELVDNCIKTTDTTIGVGGKELIIELSGLFPAPAHLLGYYAFRLDRDYNIDRNDVIAAQHFIVQEIKRQDFQGRLDKLGGGKEVEILKVLSTPMSERMSAVDIAKRVYVIPADVVKILTDPKRLGPYVKKTGMYFEISEPLFRIYLQWVSGYKKY